MEKTYSWMCKLIYTYTDTLDKHATQLCTHKHIPHNPPTHTHTVHAQNVCTHNMHLHNMYTNTETTRVPKNTYPVRTEHAFSAVLHVQQ